jgi:hypothetical protein
MDLIALLDRSAATAAFKADVRAYLAHEPATRVTAARPAPRVKVARVLAKLLDAVPDLAVERVSVDGVSGCSDFRGTLAVEAAGETRRFEFVWCCHWRAEEQQWRDAFGFPDQIRAAREFDWRCFEAWREVEARDEGRLPSPVLTP